MKRKRRRYGSSRPSTRPWLLPLLIWSGSAVAAAVIALIIGNTLGRVADGIGNGGIPADPQIYTYTISDVAPIDAYPLQVKGQSNETFSRLIEGLAPEADSVSLYLSEKGIPLYRSEVYCAISGAYGGGLELDEALTALHGRGLYVSCCLTLQTLDSGNTYGNDAIVAYAAALICEVLDAGADEVVLLDMPTDRKSMATVSEICAGVRSSTEGARLGCAVEYGALGVAENPGYILETYSSFADVFCLDIGAVDPATAVESFAYYFRSYPVRVLFTDTGNGERAAKASALSAIGVVNIQSVKREITSTPVG